MLQKHTYMTAVQPLRSWIAGVAAAATLGGAMSVPLPVWAADAAAAKQCESLTSLSGGDLKITRARLVEQPLSVRQAQDSAVGGTPGNLAERGEETRAPFCRVEVTIVPAPGADIRTEVWLPTKDKWNGRVLGTGNGASAGAIQYNVLVEGVTMGYAVTNTDVGTHTGAPVYEDPASFRFGYNPELRTNYVWRGIHLMTEASKKIVAAYYAKPHEKALFVGCSTGGGEAAAELQRFPEDYDGIIMGSPGIYFAHLGLFQGYAYAATHKSLAHRIGRQKLPAIEAEVLRQCDMLDGVKDGVIESPRICKFKPAAMQCKGVEQDDCLTAPQVEALTKIYDGLKNPRTGEVYYYGLQPGVEGADASRVRIAQESIGSVINPTQFGPLAWVLGPDWKADNWLTFDWDKGSEDLIKKFEEFGNNKTNILPFTNRGGKLIMWAGWGDPNFPEFNTARYYEEAGEFVGPQKDQSMRMYLAPGVYHCRGGPGPNQFGQAPNAFDMSPEKNLVVALDQWVSKGIAPKAMIATKFEDDNVKKRAIRTRPVCPYPQVAKWDGKGSTDDHKSFSCVTPPQE